MIKKNDPLSEIKNFRKVLDEKSWRLETFSHQLFFVLKNFF